jgi:hypothetical protein
MLHIFPAHKASWEAHANYFSYRYLDDQAGELPVAFVVGRSGSNLHEAQIKDFVAKQVSALDSLYYGVCTDTAA